MSIQSTNFSLFDSIRILRNVIKSELKKLMKFKYSFMEYLFIIKYE